MLQDYAFFTQPSSTNNIPSSITLDSRVADLENEITKLRGLLGQAKGVNDLMWETVVQKMVTQGADEHTPNSAEMDGEGNGRSRKRSRTKE